MEIVDQLIKMIGEPWDVPWPNEIILVVALFWIEVHLLIGFVIPFGAHILGYNKEQLTPRWEALLDIIAYVTKDLGVILIFHYFMGDYLLDWFNFSLEESWIFDVLLGCLTFPLEVLIGNFNNYILPSAAETISLAERSRMTCDPIAFSVDQFIIVFYAPLSEEMIFRGFLLPVLTKYMSVWNSILVSSAIFGFIHFDAQGILPLTFGSIVLGVIYSRSRNILAPILCHSLWNCFACVIHPLSLDLCIDK